MTPEETKARRAGESAKVAEFLGITYDIWDIDDCTIMADLQTRYKLIRYIREYNPDLIISHRTIDYHADHRAVAQLGRMLHIFSQCRTPARTCLQ